MQYIELFVTLTLYLAITLCTNDMKYGVVFILLYSFWLWRCDVYGVNKPGESK
jgi:hypothetical protein